MIFLVECIIACVSFTIVLELLAARRREVFINDYPSVVSEKLRDLNVVAETPPTKKSNIIRKVIAIIVCTGCGAYCLVHALAALFLVKLLSQ